MAVYKRTYKGYNGPLTNPMWRFLVLQRYAFKAVFSSRFLLIGYVACFFVPLIALCMLYLNQNASVLALAGQKPGFLKIDATWFLNFLTWQFVLAWILTAFVGPGLVAPDLANGALSVYLSRPFSRAEYILGKAMVLGSLIGSITLAPVMLLFTVQSSLVGYDWFMKNYYLGTAILLSSLLVMSVFILIGLSMSAFVRWRLVAGALVLGVFVAGKGFAAVINGVMRTSNGYFLDLQYLLSAIATDLFGKTAEDAPISPLSAWLAVLTFCALLLLMINRKLRVCEVAG
jgi:ABC-2 type transport system permease protein